MRWNVVSTTDGSLTVRSYKGELGRKLVHEGLDGEGEEQLGATPLEQLQSIVDLCLRPYDAGCTNREVKPTPIWVSFLQIEFVILVFYSLAPPK